MKKDGLALGATATAAPVTDRRIIARNKRRAKREIARTSSLGVNLEQDILNAHRADPGRAGEYMPDRYPSTAPVDYDSIPFYEQLSGYFDSSLPDFQDDADIYTDATLVDATSVSDSMLDGEMDDFAANMAFYQTDFDAFRPGANEDATLPAFDDAPNA
jgi:hypothetical protein